MENINIEVILCAFSVFIPIIVVISTVIRSHIDIEKLSSLSSRISERSAAIEETLEMRRYELAYPTLSDEPQTCEIRCHTTMKKPKHIPTNCPNCGAVIDLEQHKCEYCETPYTWLATEPQSDEVSTFLKLKEGSDRLQQQVKLEELYIEALKAMRAYGGD